LSEGFCESQISVGEVSDIFDTVSHGGDSVDSDSECESFIFV